MRLTNQTTIVIGHCEAGQTQKVRCKPERGTSAPPEIVVQRALWWPKGVIYQKGRNMAPRLAPKKG